MLYVIEGTAGMYGNPRSAKGFGLDAGLAYHSRSPLLLWHMPVFGRGHATSQCPLPSYAGFGVT
jgi:hypothetical protein